MAPLLGLHSADVTIDCWWHHNDQTIVTRALKMISNFLDIDFIHSDIHGWSWKKAISFLNWRANSAALPPTKPLPWLPHGSHLTSTKAGDAYGYFRHARSCLLCRWLLLLVKDNIKSCKIQVMRHKRRKHFLWNNLFAKINSIITVASHGHHGISDL